MIQSIQNIPIFHHSDERLRFHIFSQNAQKFFSIQIILA